MKKLLLTLLAATGLWAEAATMLPSTFQMLESVQDMMGEQRYDEAAARLDEAAKTLKKRPYDLAFVLHTRAYISLASERYGEAGAFFEQALALKALPEKTALATLISVAQIRLMLSDPDGAIGFLKQWERQAKDPAPQGFLLLASAYLEKEAYAQAYAPLKKAIALSEAPPLSWLRTLGGVCLELKKYDEAIGVYKTVVADKGASRADWMGLFYAFVTTRQEPEALDTLSAALADGVIESENDLLTLSRMQLSHGVPMRAARLIERAFEQGRIEKKVESYELYAYALRFAREHKRAIEAMRSGAALPGGDRLWAPLAQAAYEQNDYPQAVKAAQEALKYEPKNPGQLWLLMGSAAYELDDLALARSAFGEAAKEEKSRTQAERWLTHLKAL